MPKRNGLPLPKASRIWMGCPGVRCIYFSVIIKSQGLFILRLLHRLFTYGRFRFLIPIIHFVAGEGGGPGGCFSCKEKPKKPRSCVPPFPFPPTIRACGSFVHLLIASNPILRLGRRLGPFAIGLGETRTSMRWRC